MAEGRAKVVRAGWQAKSRAGRGGRHGEERAGRPEGSVTVGWVFGGQQHCVCSQQAEFAMSAACLGEVATGRLRVGSDLGDTRQQCRRPSPAESAAEALGGERMREACEREGEGGLAGAAPWG